MHANYFGEILTNAARGTFRVSKEKRLFAPFRIVGFIKDLLWEGGLGVGGVRFFVFFLFRSAALSARRRGFRFFFSLSLSRFFPPLTLYAARLLAAAI